jgi:hypothetical protein
MDCFRICARVANSVSTAFIEIAYVGECLLQFMINLATLR